MVFSSITTKRLVLRLYRDLHRYGSNLQFTDRNYFLKRVRSEFEQNRKLTDTQQIEFAYKRGRTLLDQALVI
ncbi:MIEF1 upstream open reading frame protein [Toxorhynchites rutilus septentrionalis]|uniref:MIEF1 upstream open reading frame protein n=1 Tax=Toxorhynchites rutilus septentrionalis TaxID=329112 RepID=UPI002478A305|nr:MIEF1 upstream open reading frame protein [Toxorhynchites rutilus septentrionalis]